MATEDVILKAKQQALEGGEQQRGQGGERAEPEAVCEVREEDKQRKDEEHLKRQAKHTTRISIHLFVFALFFLWCSLKFGPPLETWSRYKPIGSNQPQAEVTGQD